MRLAIVKCKPFHRLFVHHFIMLINGAMKLKKVDLAQVLGWIATFLFSIMIIPQMIIMEIGRAHV